MAINNEDELKTKLALNGKGYDYVQYFNPYRMHRDNIEVFVKGIPYIFMTSPMLNLTKENIASDSFLAYLFGESEYDPNRHILRNLTFRPKSKSLENYVDSSGWILGTCNNRFIPIITNTALSIDLKDTVSRTKEVGETFYGYKQVHPGSLVDSVVGDEISIKYLELSNLPIIKTHKAWQTYIEKIRRGSILPSKKAIELGFIDYMVSIYYFLCDFDGETIKYWAKYTGVTPLNVPYSSLGGELNSHEIPDITINYLYCYKEDMTMGVLRDFNRLAKSTDLDLDWGNTDNTKKEFIDPVDRPKNLPEKGIIYDMELDGTTKAWYPCIVKEKIENRELSGNHHIFKLKFLSSDKDTSFLNSVKVNKKDNAKEYKFGKKFKR